MEQQSSHSNKDFARPETSLFGRYLNPKSFKSYIEPPSITNIFSWSKLLGWFYERGHPKIPKEEVY
jgi:hypothetical protein